MHEKISLLTYVLPPISLSAVQGGKVSEMAAPAAMT